MTLSPRGRLAVAAGGAAALASRLAGRGRGQVIGGRVMLRLHPGLIGELAAPLRTILVSATNGKSTTTRLLAEALRTTYRVAHNATGANMAPGVATALAAAPHAEAAAIEVDEAHLPALLDSTGAGVIVLMNLSRDQLDRGAEVTLLARRWRDMIDRVNRPLTVVANCDDPLVAWAAEHASNPVWVAAGQWWREDAVLCPHCAHPLTRQGRAWRCDHCGLARPEPDWVAEGSQITAPDGATYLPHLRLPGRFNIGNAAMAAAAAQAVGVPPEASMRAFAQVGDVDGRYIHVAWGGRDVRLLLGKNPASWTELIDIAGSSGRELVIAINARGADGRDPSWLWDAPFEQLAGRAVQAAGERRFDLAVRLDVAGVTVAGVAADPLEAAASFPPARPVDIVANYTAFQNLRARTVGGGGRGH